MRGLLRTDVLPTVFAGLFLILGLSTFTMKRDASRGLPIRLERVEIDRIVDHCFGDDRMIVVLLSQGSDAQINETHIGLEKTPAEMKLIMDNRETRCVFIVPGQATPFQTVVSLYEGMRAAVPDLHVYVLRREILEQ